MRMKGSYSTSKLVLRSAVKFHLLKLGTRRLTFPTRSRGEGRFQTHSCHDGVGGLSNHAESGEPSAGQRIGEERTEGLRVTNPKTMEGLVQLLSDEYSRKIAMSAVSKAKSVEELSQEDNVPLSTCYRRVHELVDSGIMIIERIVITAGG